jgi:Zn-dependent protease
MDPVVAGVVWYVAFVFSVTVHEAGHALVAKLGGDLTAYEGGQVSLDPMPHMRREPFGMLILPIISLVAVGWPLGFASTPFDPTWAVRHPKRAAWMSLAGPGANLLVLLACVAIVWGGVGLGTFTHPAHVFYTHIVEARSEGVWQSVAFVLSIFFSMNLILLAFNLIPFPPLDGAGALGLVLPQAVLPLVRRLQSNPMFSLVGLLAAWYGFPYVFRPLFSLALALLYPGAHYR